MTERLSAPFVIEQFIKAPRELVYAAFTQGEHLSHWMRPPGMIMTQCDVDAREGGSFHYGMRAEAMPQAPAEATTAHRRVMPPPIHSSRRALQDRITIMIRPQ